MAFLSAALIFDGAAASSAQAVPVPIASDISIAAKTVDFTIMFLPHFLLPNGLNRAGFIAEVANMSSPRCEG